MIRVALRMLLDDQARFLGIVIGIGFATLLVLQQIAILLGVLGLAGGPVRDAAAAQVWVMDPNQIAVDLDGSRPLADNAVEQVRGVPGVAWAQPQLRQPMECHLGDGVRTGVLLIGLDGATLAGLPPVVQGSAADLRREDAVLVSAKAAAKLRVGARALAVGDTVELNDHRAVVVGLVRTGPSLSFGPAFYTTADRVRAWAPPRRKQVAFVLVGAAPGTDPAVLATRIAAATGLKALPAARLAADSAGYFAANTGVIPSFGTAVVLGLIVGAVVPALLFGQFIRDNLRYLGAFAAMGATRGVLRRMVLAQVAVAGAIGFGFGAGCAGLFGLAVAGSELSFTLPPWLLLGTAALVSLIILGAGMLALRQVLRLEPAQVFRG